MSDLLARENEILEKLKKAGENMTPVQKRQQEISFIMGMQGSNSTVTREYVEAELDKLYGKPVEK